MKNKFISLLLIAIMLFAVASMTSCGDQDVNPFEGILAPTTITLISIRGEGTTDEAIKAVEKELNVITRAQYNVNLQLVLYSEAEYEAKLAQRILAAESEKQNSGSSSGNLVAGTKKEDIVYETIEKDGFTEFVYPSATENQVDIFLIRDQATYNDFIAQGKVQSLSTQITNAYSNMAKYINKTLRDAMRVNNATYAIPNNHLLGNYTYLLLNKALVDELGYKAEDLTSLYALSGYLAAVKEQKTDYVPLFNCATPATALIEEGTMLGTFPSSNLDVDSVMPTLLLQNEDYAKYLAAKQAYTELGYITYGNFNSSVKCGASFVTGLPESITSTYSEEYYTIPYGEPTITTPELYSSMYAVSATTPDVSRCMDIISLLTTDQKFRNIFQYGVENVHYTAEEILDEYSSGATDEDKTMTTLITKISNAYNMNPLYTGNSYLLYPNTEMSASERALMASQTYAAVKEVLGDTMTDAEWVGMREQALAKCLNNAAIKSPYYGFSLNANKDPKLATTIATVKENVASGLAKIQNNNTFAAYLASNPGATVTDYVDHLRKAYSTLGLDLSITLEVVTLLSTEEETDPLMTFREWYLEQYPQYVLPEAPEGGADSTPAA